MQLKKDEFWAYAYDTLLNNTTRGHLAEYLVASAGGIDVKIPRVEWQPYDLLTPAGKKIEVKSSAYLQAWHQPKPSTDASIRFSIAKSRAWDAQTGLYEEVKKRQADAYVFALYEPFDKGDNESLLNSDHWRFWMIPTAGLEEHFLDQQSLSLKALKKLAGEGLHFEELQKLFGQQGGAHPEKIPAVETELSKAYEATHYKVSDYPHNFTLRIGQASPAIQAMLWDLSADSALFITAYNPFSQERDATQNQTAQVKLGERLEVLGALATFNGEGVDPTGQWPGEPSFLALGLPEEIGQLLVREFSQNAFVFIRRDKAPELIWNSQLSR